MFTLTDEEEWEIREMINNREERETWRYERKNSDGGLTLVVDTCPISDADKPYETAVSHVDYNPGQWAVVELYDTQEEAEMGHQKWVEMMTAEVLPDKLVDVSTSKYLVKRGYKGKTYPRIERTKVENG